MANPYRPLDAPDLPGIQGDAGHERSTSVARWFTARGATPQRTLVIVHRRGLQAVEDWFEIAAHVCRIAPAITVLVVSSEVANPEAAEQAARLPTLVFSPGPLAHFSPTRGKVYQRLSISKFEQLRRLAAAGLPIPLTAMLTPELELDPARWGEFVVLKPTHIESSSHGRGINLMRTDEVRYRHPDEYPADHPGRLAPMFVQQFIDTGPHISAYRVLSLFGRALYCQLMRAPRPRIVLGRPEAEIIASQAIPDMLETWSYSADAASIAQRAYAALPEAALQGCDILCEARTGRHYLLEVNPGGNTWHFSSNFLAARRAENGPAFEAQRRSQLDAFGTAAHVLAERTLAEAV